MRNLLKIILVNFMLVAPVLAADVKIGVVDMEKAVMQTTKAKSMGEQFVKDFSKDEEAIKKMETDLKALGEKIKAGGSPTLKTNQDLIKQFQSKKQDRDVIVNKIKQAEQERLQQLHAAVDPKIKDVMKDIATKGGYSIILDRKEAPYFNDSDDVTQQMTEKLNQALK